MHTTRVSLLLRLKNPSDGTAWREFDEIYRPLMHRYATLRGLDHSTAEDVVQQCMTAIHEHIGRFDYDPSKGRFKGWIRTMVNNRFRNLLRDKKDQIAESQDFKRADAKQDAPEELFDRVWMDEHLKHALRMVREEVEASTFQAFKAYVLDEQPIDEVCAELEMTANQVHRIKYRVTKKLGEKMALLTGEEVE